MALNFLLGDASTIHSHDSYSMPPPITSEGKSTFANRVIIECKKKHRLIYATLSGDFSFDASSEWASFMCSAGSGIGSNVINTLDTILQHFGGASIRQPWMGRKVWQGTTPLTFTIPLQFSSFINAKEEVYDPMVDLLALVHPRIASSSRRNGSGAAVLERLIIPGPTIFYDPFKDNPTMSNSGDIVSVSIGNFIRFSTCYFRKVAVTVSNSFNHDGWPHNIKVDVTFESMDTPYVDKDFNFMNDGFKDQSNGFGSAAMAVVSFAKGLFDKGKDAMGNVIGVFTG